jgi:predicted nuclease of predicted toxin-antitoxin system
MKFLIDQDVYAVTVRLLKSLGHDTLTAAEIGYTQASDIELLTAAQERDRILLIRDRDFGNLVFVRGINVGVIYLRILPSTLKESHRELESVLMTHSEEELRHAFIVIEPGRHRFRRLPR